MSRRGYRIAKVVAEIAVPVAILLVWQLWTASAGNRFYPRLSTILVVFRHTWLFDRFGSDVVPSLERVGLGFAIAVVVGVAVGLPLGLSPTARRAVEPLVEYWRAMPPPALLPIFFVLLGIGNTEKIALIAFVCSFPVLLNTVDGVRGIDPTLEDTARSYGIVGLARIRRIVLPAALPQIFAGARTSLPLAVIMMVISELYASTSGIGFYILQAKNLFQMAPMWAGIVLLGVLGYLLNVLFLLAERYLLAWHRGWRARSPAA